MCKVGSCCFGLTSLELGAKIIAIAGIVLYVLQLVSNAGYVGYAGLAGGVFGLIVSILLLIGAQYRKPILVLIYLICMLVIIILNIAALIEILIRSIKDDNFFNALGGLVMFILNLALTIYFEIVVYSYYGEIKGTGSGVGVV